MALSSGDEAASQRCHVAGAQPGPHEPRLDVQAVEQLDDDGFGAGAPSGQVRAQRRALVRLAASGVASLQALEAQRVVGPLQSAVLYAAASSPRTFSTSSSWVFGETFGITCTIVPPPSTMNVARSAPQYLRPYIDFSAQTP